MVRNYYVRRDCHSMLYRNIYAVLATAVGCEQPSQITPKDVACWSQDRVSERVSPSQINSQELVYKQVMSIPIKYMV